MAERRLARRVGKGGRGVVISIAAGQRSPESAALRPPLPVLRARENISNVKGSELDHASFGEQLRTAWSKLRYRPVAFSAGCGCSGGFGTLTVRDFEEALVFHVQERWRRDPALAGLADLEKLDDIIGWAAQCADPQSAAGRLDVLKEIRRSVDAFASTCAMHRFRAEAV